MIIKEKWRIAQFRRSVKKMSGSPSMIIRIGIGDNKELAEVWQYDGKALVVPGSLRNGIMLVDWSKLMRFVHRHKLV